MLRLLAAASPVLRIVAGSTDSYCTFATHTLRNVARQCSFAASSHDPGAHAAVRAEYPARSVQDYIDETPVWADATPVRYSPMTSMQWLIWGLAAAGKFFEGVVVFTTGVALPLMAQEFALGATEKGVIAAASLFGILIGATALGDLADRYGRKQMFIIEMLLFGLFITLLTFSPSYLVVVRRPGRHRHRARLRLSDRPSDHFRKHAEPHPRPDGAGRVRLSGRGRPGGHRPSAS